MFALNGCNRNTVRDLIGLHRGKRGRGESEREKCERQDELCGFFSSQAENSTVMHYQNLAKLSTRQIHTSQSLYTPPVQPQVRSNLLNIHSRFYTAKVLLCEAVIK